MVKYGDDFRQLAFKDITHECIKGRQYKFDDNIWLVYFADEYDSLAKTLAVRRCNNFLRWVNPDNGNIEETPCIIDYDMASPSMQMTQSILTPNNHATIMVQGNVLTCNQLKTNMRFIIGNRPFKLYGYQNAIMNDLSSSIPTLLYLDLYLDEKQANDNFITSVAFNGRYDYTIIPSQLSIEGQTDSIGKLTANVLLNGSSIIRPLVWQSTNLEIIQIDNNGNYTIAGEVGDTATITVGIEGNTVDVVNIPITVVETVLNTLDIYIDSAIDKIREYESIEFVVKTNKHGANYTNFTSVISLNEIDSVLSNDYLAIVNTGLNAYKLSCVGFGAELQTLYITVTDTLTSDQYTELFNIRTVNMFG